MSDFMKICVTFSISKLQKCNTCQNGVEFCHKPISDDVQSPLLYFLPLPLDRIHGSLVPSNNNLFYVTVPSMKKLFDGTLSSMVLPRKKLFENTLIVRSLQTTRRDCPVK